MPESLEDTLVNSTAPDATGLPEPTHVAEPTQPAYSLPESIASRMQAAGLDTNGIDSQDKLHDYLLRTYESTRPYAEFGKSALSQQPGNVAGKQSNPEPAADQQDEPPDFDLDGHFNTLWKTPELDPAAQYAVQAGIVQLGEDGLFEAVPGREALALPVLNKLNEARMTEREQMQGLFKGNFYSNTFKAYQPAIEHLVNQRLEAALAERFQQRDHQGFEEKFIEQNRAWLYGPDGQSFSADGQKFVNAVTMLKSGGVNEPQKLAEWALKLAGINTHAGSAGDVASPAAPVPPAPNNGNPRDEQGRFIKGAGTPPVTAEPPKSKQESFLDDARRKAALSQSQGGYTGNEPVVASDGELDSMWTNDWKKHVAGAA
jgi:hypothetical protein